MICAPIASAVGPMRHLLPRASIGALVLAPSVCAQRSIEDVDPPLDPQGHANHAGHSPIVGNLPFSLDGVFDFVADGVDNDPGLDGFDADLRVFELLLGARISKDWNTFSAIPTDGDNLVVEEGGLRYEGLGQGLDQFLGRFYLPFGAQMHQHIHELPYPERPGVLRDYMAKSSVSPAHRSTTSQRPRKT